MSWMRRGWVVGRLGAVVAMALVVVAAPAAPAGAADGFRPGSPGLGDPFFPQFIALAERASGRNLRHFFDVWLFQPRKPTSW